MHIVRPAGVGMPALVRKTPQEEGSLPKTYDDDKQPVFSVEQMGLHCLRHSQQASAKSHCSWPLSALKRSRDMLRRQIEQECNALEINRIAVSSSADTSDGAGDFEGITILTWAQLTVLGLCVASLTSSLRAKSRMTSRTKL